MNLSMRRAFAVLQMPSFELSEWLYSELSKNPIFEVKRSNRFQHLDWIEKKDSFYEYLEKEIILHFRDPKQREVAYFIAGSLNGKGFLTVPQKEICKTLKITAVELKNVLVNFHQIEPIGLGAQDAREALLLQLTHRKEGQSPLYRLINKHFEDLLHNRIDVIAKGMNISIQEVKQLISEKLKSLDPFPGSRFSCAKAQEITPDLFIHQEDGFWKVGIPGDDMPNFYINPYYTKLLKQETQTVEERNFIRRHLASGKWLIRTLERRNKILMAIGSYVVKKQRSFLEGRESTPFPLKREEAAASLQLSKSTIARAIYQKYVSTPRGILPLNFFFPRSLKTTQKPISPRGVKTLVGQLIEKEDKQAPLSDQALSEQLKAKGIFCARRTVAKYRKELKISPSCRRKEWL